MTARSLDFEIDYADDRMVRLMLGRLIEPEDHLFAELREYATPAELLRAIVRGEPPGPRASPESLGPPGLPKFVTPPASPTLPASSTSLGSPTTLGSPLSSTSSPTTAESSRLTESTRSAAESPESSELAESSRSSVPAPWPERLAARFAARRPGLWLRLARTDPDEDLAVGTAADARFLVPGDEGWPRALDDLGGRAPFGVWMIGSFPPQVPAVAVVGARACTGYGNQAAGQLSAELARSGAVVVSGAALGVDGAAHRGALAVGGLTVAVLACGIDRSYPATHTALIQAIGQRGAVVAELPPGTSPTRFRFLARNRLIAALGLATVVVEAAGRSGSLVTARLAAELGRAVFAVPGPVTSRQSTGTNQLLCDGATPAVDGAQVLAELGLEITATPSPASFTQTTCRSSAASLELTSSSTSLSSLSSLTSLAEASTSLASTASLASLSSASSPAMSEASSTDAATALAPSPMPRSSVPSSPAPPSSAPPLDPLTVLVREVLPTARSGRAAEVLALAAETGLEPARVLAALGLLAARGQAVKTGSGWALR